MAGVRPGVDVSMYEAALNTLREERRAVTAARGQLLRDEDLRQSDPQHRNQLLAQTMAELAQLSRAITLLERVQSGDLVEMDVASSGLPPAPYRRHPAPARQTGLIRKVQPAGGRA